ncbi:MAG TPA: transcription antitermination factor NusB [Anaerolineales bacterium]|nr:transcription antitermination factor NusB [Anaerolineales bacterium]
MKARRRARALALQALYEIDSVGHPPDVVLEERLAETPLPEAAAEFSRHLVSGVLRYRSVLDRFIQEHAPEWPVEQMACIDRNILRIALFEFAVDGSTPVKVAINEAVELAKMFGSDSSSRFVNGVLGALVSRKSAIARAVQKIEPEQE